MMVQTLRDLTDLAHPVRDEDDGDLAFRRQPAEHFEQPLRFPGGEVGGGLVEEQELGARFQGTRDLHQLLLVQRQPADLRDPRPFSAKSAVDQGEQLRAPPRKPRSG